MQFWSLKRIQGATFAQFQLQFYLCPRLRINLAATWWGLCELWLPPNSFGRLFLFVYLQDQIQIVVPIRGRMRLVEHREQPERDGSIQHVPSGLFYLGHLLDPCICYLWSSFVQGATADAIVDRSHRCHRVTVLLHHPALRSFFLYLLRYPRSTTGRNK